MFSSSQKIKRKRGVILSSEGWQRLCLAQKNSEQENNAGLTYTVEELTQMTGLSSHTLTKVRRRHLPVDRQTLSCYFQAFNLTLEERDYIKPTSRSMADCSDDLEGIFSPSSERLEPSLPEGQVSLKSQFYIKRSPGAVECCRAIQKPGCLVRIKAPRKMGKSSLMVRVVDCAKQQDYQTVFLSLQMAERSILHNLDKFLQWFSASVSLGLHLTNRLDAYWDELFGSKISCKMYFEQHLLAKSTQPVLLVLDDVDRLFDYPELADEFFGLLRSWHEQAKNGGVWQQLRLIVAHSSEVYIPLNTNKSPFNVGVPIELQPFTGEQVEELAEKYHLELSQLDIKKLMEISGGQPYLVQLGLYSLKRDNLTVGELLEEAIAGTGIFANHLQRLLWTLQQNSDLAATYGRIIDSSSPVDMQLLQAFKLESLGLVKLQGNQVVSSCNLYTSYFGDRLSEQVMQLAN